MIFDSLDQADRYSILHPGFAAGFAFLRQTQLSELPIGKRIIDGDRLFALVGRDPAKGSTSPLEAHQRYIDIQYLVAGREQIGWRQNHGLRLTTPYDDKRDIAFFGDVPTTWINMVPGQFAIFFPQDAHAPLAGTGAPHKVVVKVLLDWK